MSSHLPQFLHHKRDQSTADRSGSLTHLPAAPPLPPQPTLTAFSDLAVTFRQTTGMTPPPLAGCSLTVIDHTLYLFGGRVVANRKMSNELYSLNLPTLFWRHHSDVPGIPPEPRYFHSANRYGDSVILFGGMGQRRSDEGREGNMVLGDIHLLETKGGKLKWTKPAVMGLAPQPRYAHLTVVDGKRLVVLGGQDIDNQYVEDCFLLDLTQMAWIHNIRFPCHYGVYRTVAARYEGKCVVYSNYNFTEVKRELYTVESHTLKMSDFSDAMTGDHLPPGLRFPTGNRLGDRLIVSGTYLTNNSQSFCVWQLDLKSFTWSRLFLGQHLDTGSWNRACLDAARDRYIIFGNRNRALLGDYEHRRINFEHVVLVQLDAWGIYEKPRVRMSSLGQELGDLLLDSEQFADFVICAMGNNNEHYIDDNIMSPPLPLLPYSPSSTTLTSVSKEALETVEAPRDGKGGEEEEEGKSELRVNSALLRRRWPYFSNWMETNPPENRVFSLPETFPVLQAFIRFLYTDVLPPTLPLNILGDLLCLSETYHMSKLMKRVAVLLHEKLRPETAWRIFCYARRTSSVGLKVRALKMMEGREGRQYLERNASWWSERDEEDARDEVIRLIGVKYRGP